MRLSPTKHVSFTAALLALSFSAAALFAQSSRPSRGWVSLFDGKTMDHWNDPRKLNPPGDAWTIEDGCLKTNRQPRIDEDLISTGSYGNFELAWEWKIASGGNSGVKYRVQALPVLTASTTAPDSRKFEDKVAHALQRKSFDRSVIGPAEHAQIYVVGFEYQMIDNARHPDAQRGGLYQSGALYSIAAPSKDASKTAGEWNQSRLVVQGEHFEHWLNGQKIVDVNATPDLLQHALLKRWGADSEVLRLLSRQPRMQCPITLQNHGDNAWFRNIKIRQLP